jgi:hypothetical protein
LASSLPLLPVVIVVAVYCCYCIHSFGASFVFDHGIVLVAKQTADVSSPLLF